MHTVEHRSLLRTSLTAVLCLLVAGCRGGDDAARSPRHVASAAASDSLAARDSLARARQDSINRTLPGYVIDSILPVEETVRRFRSVIGGEPVSALRHGSPSRDALVSRFVRALVAADSGALHAMAIDAREFIDVVYPESPNTKPPFQQDPALVWRTIQNPSASGLTRLMRRAGGVPVRLSRYACASEPLRQGRNRFWRDCQLTLVGPQGDTSVHRFFGTVIERGGQFKFLSYRNEF